MKAHALPQTELRERARWPVQLRGVALGLAALVWGASLLHGATLYTNEVDFTAAIGGSRSYLNEFINLTESGQRTHPLRYASNGLAYEITSQPLFNIFALTGAVSTVTNSDEIVVTFTSGNVRAAGGWLFLTDTDGLQTTGSVRVSLSDGTTHSYSVSGISPPPFAGFSSANAPFTWLRLGSETGDAFPTLDHFYAAEGLPVLTIANSGTNAVIISWPAPAPGYVLQTSPALGGTNWTDVALTPELVGGRMQVVVPISVSEAYFRLVKQ